MKMAINRSAECHSAVSPNGIRRNARSTSAYTLIEMLVYMAMLAVLFTLGYAAMYKSMDASTGLRRNANDITQALNAGERWREDVRAATQAIRLDSTTNEESLLHIPQPKAEVMYRFASNCVSRRVGTGEWSPALEHVNASAFISDPRQKVVAWKWEVELQPYRKSLTRLHPLFTFLAVPAAQTK